MAQIFPYEGEVRLPRDIQRFVASANGSPALMIEFYPRHYHVYGPRAAKVSEVLQETRDATKLLNLSEARTRYTFQLNTKQGEYFASGEPLSVVDLNKQVSDINDVEFLSISSELVSLWSDIAPSQNPRSGVATRTRLFQRDPFFVRHLTQVELSDRELSDIAAFLAEQTSFRYPG